MHFYSELSVKSNCEFIEFFYYVKGGFELNPKPLKLLIIFNDLLYYILMNTFQLKFHIFILN